VYLHGFFMPPEITVGVISPIINFTVDIPYPTLLMSDSTYVVVNPPRPI